MQKKKSVLVMSMIVACLFLSACAKKIDYDKFRKSVGMSKKEVLSYLGKPDVINDEYNSWTYPVTRPESDLRQICHVIFRSDNIAVQASCP